MSLYLKSLYVWKVQSVTTVAYWFITRIFFHLRRCTWIITNSGRMGIHGKIGIGWKRATFSWARGPDASCCWVYGFLLCNRELLVGGGESKIPGINYKAHIFGVHSQWSFWWIHRIIFELFCSYFMVGFVDGFGWLDAGSKFVTAFFLRYKDIFIYHMKRYPAEYGNNIFYPLTNMVTLLSSNFF